MRKGKYIKNADLWQKLDELVSNREVGSLQFTKVKGHATTEDVLSARSTDIDKVGNDAADQLAVAGALFNKLRRPQIELKRKNLKIAVRVQRMMLEIHAMRARSLTDARAASGDADNSSNSTEGQTETSSTSETTAEATDAPT